ncbi:glycoside hydrolase family 9 protein [Cellulomonas dongxiuzhuiae]|uniref:Glycoside hydrolase family 9 protein n=1 Tax=Cellulomonas dongxiuzhuiae TaxID=2819979 RepID=A0ABX8GK32_9CELL|nr:glycoside hydrolase family 9 protein [Cellulomonas dongxiuzhuiae]MBO3095567.1 glycoside hydrolase family 9 protein [Cellulomonas dongxiuzhuiae]QWC16538.1 glycoside hydrolase family 9 protein [Cellulomonas dongxiuzhuiae]
MSRPTWSVQEVLARRPAVRVNQLGHVPGTPARATLVAPDVAPVAFRVVREDGRVVHEGTSVPWPVRPEPTSGLPVHVLELGDLDAGTYRVEAGSARSHPFRVDDGIHAALRDDALRFFTLMRSGTAITVPGYARPAGHPDTAVPAWTGPAAAHLYPGWHDDGTYDVSGGWYDAGDYGKYVTSGAIAAWQLLGTLDLVPGDRRVADECRWQLDWLLRMQVPPGRPLAGLAFHRVHGTTWSPLPGWPHLDPTERVLHRPSTTATLHLAAAAAAGARHLRTVDPAYAHRLETAARSAYDAARQHPALLPPDDHARHGGGPYDDADVGDDLYWAAAELWLATGDPAYEQDVLRSPEHAADPFDDAGFDFDAVGAPARLDLALHGSGLADHDRVVESVRAGADRLLAVQRRQPWGQPYAPAAGWSWGSNGRLLNNLVVLAVAHLVTGDAAYRDAVAEGTDHLLGRNALGQSYVTGHGTDHSHHQRTRQFGHDLDPAMPPPPPGALAGGANSIPAPDFPYDRRLVGQPPQCCYLDEPTSEVTNDVCIRWNAPLVWVAAYLDRFLAAGSALP